MLRMMPLLVAGILTTAAAAADTKPTADCIPRPAHSHNFRYSVTVDVGARIFEHPPGDDSARRLVMSALEKFNADKWEDAADLLAQALAKTQADEHETRAEILHQIGASQSRLKQYSVAESTIRKAILEAQAAKRLSKSSRISLNQTLISIVFIQGRYVEAEQLVRGNLELLRASSSDDPQLIEAKRELGAVLFSQKKYKEAEPFAREAVERAKRQGLRDDDMTLVRALAELGEILHKQDRFQEGLPYLKAAIEHWPDDSAVEREWHSAILIYLGRSLDVINRTAESLPIFRRGIEMQKAVLGDHFVTIDSQIIYAATLNHADEKPEMLRVLVDALAMKARLGEAADEQAAYLSMLLGVWYVNTGERERGVEHVRRGAEICQRVECQPTLLGDLQRLRSIIPELAQ